MDLKEAVLARVDMVEFVGRYTALKQNGREWRGLCPFHSEKTPSFYVVPEKGFYHCFGCKASGNLIGFAMQAENLEFVEALEWLARRYNIEAPREQRAAGSGGAGVKQRLIELNEAARGFYQEQLRSPAGAAARDYLARRGIEQRALDEFDLGYAPREWTALTDRLLGGGARAPELQQLGLIKPREGGGHYDTFRHRLIFPIRSGTGVVCAFAGRALAAEDQPKYLNVTNTPLYDKSRTLYNLDRARGLARDEGLVIVEGYMDVIGLAQAGVGNAVAACGTALTPEHVLLLARSGATRFYLAFDGDQAGREAVWRAGQAFLTAGHNPRVVALPPGADPDELARGEGGAARWAGLLAESADSGVAGFRIAHLKQLAPEAGTLERRRWITELSALYQQLPDALIRAEVARDIASGLNMGGAEIKALLESGAQGAGQRYSHGGQRAVQQAASLSQLADGPPLEREILRRLLSDPELLHCYRLSGGAQWFADQQLRALYERLAAGEPAAALLEKPETGSLVARLQIGDGWLEDSGQLMQSHLEAFHKRECERVLGEIRRASERGDAEAEARLTAQLLDVKRLMKSGAQQSLGAQ